MVTAAFGRPGYWFLTVAQFLVPFTGEYWLVSNQECIMKRNLTSILGFTHTHTHTHTAMAAYTIIVGDTFSRIMWQICKPFYYAIINSI